MVVSKPRDGYRFVAINLRQDVIDRVTERARDEGIDTRTGAIQWALIQFLRSQKVLEELAESDGGE
jgi:metal-responsive CopG/Arc/MetJ family transcriptional regulator